MSPPVDANRRTHLANERTFLAWWRTGFTALAVALGVGRIAPELTDGPSWPYAAIGAGYAVLGVALIAYGSRRQRAVEEAIAAGRFDRLRATPLFGLSILAIALGVASLVLVIAQP